MDALSSVYCASEQPLNNMGKAKNLLSNIVAIGLGMIFPTSSLNILHTLEVNDARAMPQRHRARVIMHKQCRAFKVNLCRSMW